MFMKSLLLLAAAGALFVAADAANAAVLTYTTQSTFVAAFGAMGHHLPGMIRAYGDGALFQRFKWLFVFAPVFLVAVCVMFFVWDLRVISLVVFFWCVWHGLRQA